MSGTGGEMYSLKWNHYHTYLTSGLAQLIDDSEDSMTDVNLACEGQFIQAHKLILSLCSPFFKQLFRVNRMEKSNYINVVLTGVKFKDLKNILHFIYHGEVNVGNAELNHFLQAAEVLQIEGLAGGVENNQQETVLTTETKKPTASVLAPQGPPPPAPSTTTSSLITHNNGAPPNKRSRLSVSTSSSNMLNTPLSTSRLGSQISQTSHRSVTSMSVSAGGMSSNVIIESGNQTSTIASDPLENDEGGSIDECGEEMISLDAMKSEPIAVYTITENNAESDEIHTGTRNPTTRNHGGESDGMLYDFESHVIQTSSNVGAPGPSSSSAIMRPRVTGVQKADKRIVENIGDDSESDDLEILSPLPKQLSVNAGQRAGSLESPSSLLLKEVFSLAAESPYYAGSGHGMIGVGVMDDSLSESRPVCQFCGKAFKNRNTLNNHRSVYHRDETRRTRPSFNLGESNSEEYKVPDTYPPLDNFQMRCKTCGENVPSDSFQTHGCYSSQVVGNQAIGIVQPVQCTICLKTFKNRNSLKVHKSTYHRPKDTAPSGMRLSHLAEIITTSSPPMLVTTESSVKTYPSAASSSHQTQSMIRNECNDNKSFQLPMYAQPHTLLAILHQQQQEQSYSEFDNEEKKPSA
ncbi:Broad-complex core protein isoforms 1/2/3/4/5 [Orchesella cincta]|uniref:Broad-complex core protein isoforms 1/2/3/4/5 n=1 Tax=Orchesella cincta TaxID=48709 RepID=A0A1D2N389_ORCCI|nr:Broad-complex core protein isoforms 1/2/3/4/5 [Orchesella cincta]